MTEAKQDGPGWGRTILGWLAILASAFTVHTVAAKPFYIPSGSMMPVLEKGDRLIVSRYPYGWSYASLSIHGSDVIPGRIMGKLPARGDIVTVARRGDGEDLIKRVIGLPGDTVEVRGGALWLNGAEVPREAHGTAHLAIDANLPCDGDELRFQGIGKDGRRECQLPLFRETLPGGVRYDTVDKGYSPADDFGPVTVPQGHVFLMGDNRDDSADSRYALEVGGLGGPVPVETLSGRAEFITHSFSGEGAWINPLAYITALRTDRAWSSLRPEKVADKP